MDQRPRSLVDALEAARDAALDLHAAIHALAGGDGYGGTGLVLAADRECASVVAIAAGCDRDGDRSTRSYDRACAHLHALEGLLEAGLLHAAKRCDRIADGLAQREEWVGLFSPSGERGARAIVACELAQRLRRLLVEHSP
jgi:hypothetical protein